jgi:ergot alkaloid biosynthesis protein
MREKILVLGGTGKTGRPLVAQLRAAVTPVRIGTRSPRHADEVAFDWTRPELAQAAFHRVWAVYIIAPTHSADHGTIVPPVLEEALRQGVQRFVLLSASSLERGGPMMGQIHDWMARNTRDWAVLRLTWFMQNFSEQQHLPTIRDESAIYTATGSGRVGFIDATDIARVAAAALSSKEAWNRDLLLTGPEALSYTEVADCLSRVLGRQIRHVNLSVEALAARHRAAGMDAEYAQLLAGMDAAIASGSEDCTSPGVLRATGQPPLSFEAFALRERPCWNSPT